MGIDVFITKAEKSLVEDDWKHLIANPRRSVEIDYKSYVSAGTFDPSTGGMVPTFATDTVRAIESYVSQGDREIVISGGIVQIGDYRYTLLSDDIPEPTTGDPSLNQAGDQVIAAGSVARFVYRVQKGTLGITRTVYTRDIGKSGFTT